MPGNQWGVLRNYSAEPAKALIRRPFVVAQSFVAVGCKRLIKNAIVCWNYLFLMQKIADQEDQDTRQTWLKSVAAGSVVAWRHVNLLGEYDFSEEKLG